MMNLSINPANVKKRSSRGKKYQDEETEQKKKQDTLWNNATRGK